MSGQMSLAFISTFNQSEGAFAGWMSLSKEGISMLSVVEAGG